MLRIWLHRSEHSPAASHEQTRVSVAERRNVLALVASVGGVGGSLSLQANARVCSAVLAPGHHIVHELADGRSAWLHVVEGDLVLGDVALTAGDGAGVTGERAVSVTARKESEILLVDVPDRPADRR
jgi:redox-sensitive bicupin YhaK (pirin superfamily)